MPAAASACTSSDERPASAEAGTSGSVVVNASRACTSSASTRRPSRGWRAGRCRPFVAPQRSEQLRKSRRVGVDDVLQPLPPERVWAVQRGAGEAERRAHAEPPQDRQRELDMRGQVVVERDRRRKTRAATALRGCSLQFGGGDDAIRPREVAHLALEEIGPVWRDELELGFAAAGGEAVIDDGDPLPPTAQAQQPRQDGRKRHGESAQRATRPNANALACAAPETARGAGARGPRVTGSASGHASLKAAIQGGSGAGSFAGSSPRSLRASERSDVKPVRPDRLASARTRS